MAINDKLNRIKEIKEDIKQALIDKGVEVTDEDSFGSYADKITNIPMEGGDPYYEELYNARTNNGTNMAGLFARMSGDSLDLTELDASQCTDMSYMFEKNKCNNIDCSGWDVSNVNKADYMFSSCSANINTTGWDTSNWSSLYYLFNFFKGGIDISNWNTGNITNVQYMFSYAKLTDIDGISALKLPKVTSYGNMFDSAECDTTLDLSNWNIDTVTNLSRLFYSTKIKRIDLSNWNTKNVTNMERAFNFSYSSITEELIIPDWDMTNTTNYSSLFGSSNYVQKLRYIDLSRSNDLTISRIASSLPARTESTYGNVAIPADSSQEVIDALIAKYWKPIGPSFNVESFQISSELDEVLLNGKTKVVCHSHSPWYAQISETEFVSSDESIATVNENGEITAISLGNVEIYARLKDNPEVVSNTITISIVESYSNPYEIKFKAIPASGLSNSHCVEINNLSIKLKDMDYNTYTGVYTYDVKSPITQIRFGYNDHLNSKNISEIIKFDFNSNNITSMEQMFSYCDNITSLDLSNWNTSNVNNTSMLFYGCPSLKSLDLSNWDISGCVSLHSVFDGCTSLEYLDLSSWDTTTIIGWSNLFFNVPSTCQIYVGPNWEWTEQNAGFSGTFIRTNKLTINYQDSYEPYNNPYVEFSTTVANENSKRCYLTEETEFGRRGHIYLPNNETYWIHCSNNNETHGTLSSSITVDSEKEIWIVRGEPYYFEEEPNTGVGGDYITGFDVNPSIDSFVFDSVDNRTLNLNIYPYEQGKQVSFSIFLEDSTLANSDTLWPSIDTYEYDMGYNNAIYCSVYLQIDDDLGTATLVIRESNSGIEKRISLSIAEPQPKITDFTISPESLTFSDDGTKTATVTVIPAETDRAVRFCESIGAQSQFNITRDESEAPNKYYFNIEATQLYKEEYEPVFSIYEERSGISKSIPVTIESENIWVNPQAYIVVYYYREDGNYDNAQLAYNIPSEGVSGGTGFWNSNDNGQYAGQWFLKGQEVELRVFNGWDPDDGSELIVASGTFTFTEDTELWVVDGDSTIYTEKPEIDGGEDTPFEDYLPEDEERNL